MSVDIQYELLRRERDLRDLLKAQSQRNEAFACLEFLLRESTNGVICPDDDGACDRCAANWKRVHALLDAPWKICERHGFSTPLEVLDACPDCSIRSDVRAGLSDPHSPEDAEPDGQWETY